MLVLTNETRRAIMVLWLSTTNSPLEIANALRPHGPARETIYKIVRAWYTQHNIPYSAPGGPVFHLAEPERGQQLYAALLERQGVVRGVVQGLLARGMQCDQVAEWLNLDVELVSWIRVCRAREYADWVVDQEAERLVARAREVKVSARGKRK